MGSVGGKKGLKKMDKQQPQRGKKGVQSEGSYGEEGCGLEKPWYIVRLLLRLTVPPFMQPLGQRWEDGGQRGARPVADATAQTWQHEMKDLLHPKVGFQKSNSVYLDYLCARDQIFPEVPKHFVHLQLI